MAEPLNLQGLTPPHRLCLETSFTSLQNPTVRIHPDSSKASSVTDSTHNSSSTTTKLTQKIQSPNQMNSILSYDFASLLDEQFNNAAGTSTRTLTPSVVSDRRLNQPLGVYNFGNMSNGDYRAKNLSHSLGRKVDPSFCSDNKALYLKEKDSCKVDLIHDDWFGLAPLASPESLSELSSISSRTSLSQSNERCINVITVASISRDAEAISSSEASLAPDYAMSTPKVLRRTPKIPGNLVNCADDIKNVVKYQKMNQNFRFLGRRVDGSLSNSSRESSFESATSAESGQLATVRTTLPIVRSPLKYVPSVDRSESPFRSRKQDIDQGDEFCLNVKEGFHSAENFIESKSSEESFVTKSDPNFLDISPETRNKLDKKHANGSAVKHFAESVETTINIPGNSVSTSSELFLSTKSSMHSYESCEAPMPSPGNRKAILMKGKVVYGSSLSSESSPLHGQSKGEASRLLEDSESERNEIELKKDIVKPKKKSKSLIDRSILSRKNESLPLLSNIGSPLTHSPPASYVKRKKYVYPINSVLTKGESSV